MTLLLVCVLVGMITGISCTIFAFGKKYAQRKRLIQQAKAELEGEKLKVEFAHNVRRFSDEARKAEADVEIYTRSNSALVHLLRPNADSSEEGNATQAENEGSAQGGDPADG